MSAHNPCPDRQKSDINLESNPHVQVQLFIAPGRPVGGWTVRRDSSSLRESSPTERGRTLLKKPRKASLELASGPPSTALCSLWAESTCSRSPSCWDQDSTSGQSLPIADTRQSHGASRGTWDHSGDFSVIPWLATGLTNWALSVHP